MPRQPDGKSQLFCFMSVACFWKVKGKWSGERDFFVYHIIEFLLADKLDYRASWSVVSVATLCQVLLGLELGWLFW